MLKSTLKKKFPIIIFIAFLLNVFISEISNYKSYSFYMKGISSLILIGICFFDFRINSYTLKAEIKEAIIRTSKISVIIITLPLLSLIYSENTEFGTLKIIYFITGTFPAILTFVYILITTDKMDRILFIKILILTGLIFSVVTLIISPFDPATIYEFKINRWSHVIGGRFLSSVVIIIILAIFYNYITNRRMAIFSLAIILTATYFTGLRAGLVGLIIFIMVVLVSLFIKKNWETFFTLLISISISLIAISFINKSNSTSTNRYEKLLSSEIGVYNDPGINARLEAYKVSWENIKKRPIFGVGFGGFNNERVSGNIYQIKYPHNLFIEIQLEMGIIGTIFYLILFGILFSKSYKINKGVFLFFIFSVWLAMFSKDFPTQTQLWLVISIIIYSRTHNHKP